MILQYQYTNINNQRFNFFFLCFDANYNQIFIFKKIFSNWKQNNNFHGIDRRNNN